MEVKIGVLHAPREIVLDVDQSHDDVEKLVSDALAANDGVLTLADAKGRKVLIASARIAYVEIGGGTQSAVGFRL